MKGIVVDARGPHGFYGRQAERAQAYSRMDCPGQKNGTLQREEVPGRTAIKCLPRWLFAYCAPSLSQWGVPDHYWLVSPFCEVPRPEYSDPSHARSHGAPSLAHSHSRLVSRAVNKLAGPLALHKERTSHFVHVSPCSRIRDIVCILCPVNAFASHGSVHDHRFPGWWSSQDQQYTGGVCPCYMLQLRILGPQPRSARIAQGVPAMPSRTIVVKCCWSPKYVLLASSNS